MIALLSPEAVAQRLSISHITVKRLARAGKLGHVKVGERYRFTDQHVAEYVRRNTKPAIR